MSINELHSLDLLTIPVWIVSPHTEELVFANTVARELMQAPCFPLSEKAHSPRTHKMIYLCILVICEIIMTL